MQEGLNPTDWGWSIHDNMYVLKKMDLPPAPESIFRIVRCNCKTGCGAMKCSCRKNGLECTSSCGQCRRNKL